MIKISGIRIASIYITQNPVWHTVCTESTLDIITVIVGVQIIIVFQNNISEHPTEVTRPSAALFAKGTPTLQMILIVSFSISQPPLSSYPPPKKNSFCLFQNKHHYNHFLFTSPISPWLLLLSLVVATPLNLLPSANIISYCLFPLLHY